MLKFYLIGCVLALIIEIITQIRIREFTKHSLGYMIFVAIPLSWIWVIIFMIWIYNAMGWNYKDMEGKNSPYVPIVWRLKKNE